MYGPKAAMPSKYSEGSNAETRSLKAVVPRQWTESGNVESLADACLEFVCRLACVVGGG